MEAKELNKSMDVLKYVVSSIVKEENDINWSDSVLTRLLKDELNGNWKTYFMINMSPSSHNVYETIESCKFGQYVRCVGNNLIHASNSV